MNFITGMLSDDQGRPSSQRFCLLLITVFSLGSMAAAQMKSAVWAVPTLTDSFVNLIEWLASALGLGILGPKVVNGVVTTKGGANDPANPATGV